MTPTSAAGRQFGRYMLFDEIASGGMATVHYGRLLGPAGFSRTVAIKRLHPTFARDPEFLSMFLDEARIAARIRHPNVVSTLDVVAEDAELLLVMEYVQGDALSSLMRVTRGRGAATPIAVAAGIVTQALFGLQAAHEARGEDGTPLGVIHRDISPQNLLVGVDGVTRVADFGVAKAVGRLQTTREGQVKGKTAYMAPEQMRARAVDRRADIYSASVVLWEALAGERLFAGDSAVSVMNAVLEKKVPLVSEVRPGTPPELDPIVARGLARDRDTRFDTAKEMAIAIEKATRVASPREIGEWVESIAEQVLSERAKRVAAIESLSTTGALAQATAGRAEEPGPPDAGTRTTTNHVTEAMPRARSKRARWVRSGIAVTVALGVAGVLVPYLFGGSRGASGERAAGSFAPAVVALPSPPSAATESSSSPSSSVSTAAAASAVPASKPVIPRGLPVPHAPNCKPPYTIDTSGVRHWKDGC